MSVGLTVGESDGAFVGDTEGVSDGAFVGVFVIGYDSDFPLPWPSGLYVAMTGFAMVFLHQ